MKYKLTKEAIKELEAMEFENPQSMFVMEDLGDMRRILVGQWIFEEIKPKTPKRDIWKGAYKEIKTEPFDFEAMVTKIIKKVLKEEAGE